MEIRQAHNINSLWGTLIIEELVRSGVEYFCIAPGSRSAPLTAAVALNKRAKSFVHFDERGLAFHALGYISATRKPVCLICTSGTAVANFLPAIIETSKKKLPLVVLTADRPPELQKSGSDQTIEQSGIYKNFVKWDFTFPCPTVEIKPEFVLTTIDQAVYQAKSGMLGVVHLNCMFREPLAPVGKVQNFSKYTEGLVSWGKSMEPYTTYASAEVFSKSFNPQILKSLSEIKNGIIAVGKLHSKEEQESVLKLSEKLGWPIFPDITSGLRLGNSHPHVVHYYDQILLSETTKKNFKIDGVLHLGGRMCSKRFYQFIDRIKPEHYITVLNHPLRNDPLHVVSLCVQSAVKEYCEYVVSSRQSEVINGQLKKLKKLNDAIDIKIDQFISKFKTISEITVARLISKNIPKDSVLFLASSMPIRDMDMYASHNGNSVFIGSNRGASGIDGTIASAVGFTKALNMPTTLLIGDLAFLHDLNSLAMLKELNQSFVIVVLNNNGGGIFNFLPIAARKNIFEKYFATPHDLNFEHTANMFGLNYKRIGSINEFIKSYKIAINNKKTTILEINENRIQNFDMHKKLQGII